MLNNNLSPCNYQWQLQIGNTYTFDAEDEIGETDLYFVRIKNQVEKIYKFDRVLGGGIDGTVYQLTCEEGKAKVLKWVDGPMNELWFLQKIYLTNIPHTKLSGVELPSKWVSCSKKLNYKIMPKYDFDLSQLFKVDGGWSAELAEISIRQLTKGLVTVNNCQIAALDVKRKNVFYRFKNGEHRFDHGDFGTCTHNLDTPSHTDIEKQKKLRLNYCFFKRRLLEKIILKTGEKNFTSEFLSLLKSPQIKTAEDLYNELEGMKTILK